MQQGDSIIGRTLSHYRVAGKLGAGGMGEVYLAEDLDLKRRVALKVLPPDLAGSSERLKRFQREAESLAALNHPNIVTIHSIEHAEGLRFLTMELVEGESLEKLIPDHGLELARFFDLAIPIADALSAAHEKGITHRDLKPANLMVTEDGRLKVLDFGLAKLLQPEAAADATELPTAPLTQEGMAVGTVPYMSPEQIEGKPLDPRTDIFSLGIVLYEMATGQRPFSGDSSPAVMSSILRDTPPPATELRAELPRHLARILEQCLEKRPQDRIQTARDVYNQLRSLRREVESGPVVTGSQVARAGAADTETAAPPPADTGPTVFGIPVWVIFALGGMAMGMFPLWIAFRGGPAEEPPSRATVEEATAPPRTAERPMLVVLPFDNLGPADQAYFADGISEEITGRLAAASELGVISRTSAIQYREDPPPLRQIGEELGVDYVLEGTVRWAGGTAGGDRVRITTQLIQVADDTHLWAGSYDRVLDDIFEVQSDIAGQVIDQLGVTLFEGERRALNQRLTENLGAYQAYLRGSDYLASLEDQNLILASEMFQRAVELDPEFVSAWVGLARADAVLYHLGAERSEERERRSRQAAERAIELDPRSPEGHVALGFFHYDVHKDYELALEAFDRALELRPDDPVALEGQALVLRRVMRWEESTRLLERALRLNPRDTRLVFNLADSYTQTRAYDRAEALYEQCIAIDPGFFYTYQFRALNFALWKGDLAEARAALEAMPESGDPTADWAWYWLESLAGQFGKALARVEEMEQEVILLGAVVRTRHLLAGLARLQMGQHELARKDLDRARRELAQRVRQPHDGFRFRSAYGLALAGLGRKQDAIREAERAVREYPVSRDSAWGPGVVEDLALTYTLVGEHDRALDRLDYLLSIPQTISVPLIEIDPRWAPLRAHPRYREVLGRYRS